MDLSPRCLISNPRQKKRDLQILNIRGEKTEGSIFPIIAIWLGQSREKKFTIIKLMLL
jgi:hypothetical protein